MCDAESHALVMSMVLPLVGGIRQRRDNFLRSLLEDPLKIPFCALVHVLERFENARQFLEWTRGAKRARKGRDLEDYLKLGEALWDLTILGKTPGAPGCLRQSGWRSFLSAACLQKERLEPEEHDAEILEVHERLRRVLRVVQHRSVTRTGAPSRGVNAAVGIALREAEMMFMGCM